VAPLALRIRRPPRSTIVFDTYWRFAVERQAIFFRRVDHLDPTAPQTTDPILQRFRFTNAYRASDRTSQYLIRHVIYEGPQAYREVVFRSVLFRLFNLPSTWEALARGVGPIETAGFEPTRYATVLGAHAATGSPLYSAAYVIPPVATTGKSRKYEQHLELVRWMVEDRIDERIAGAGSLEAVFRVLAGYPSLGRFLAFQLAIDLNYGPNLGFSEMDFVAAGPGAAEGIRKCFDRRDDWSDDDIIRWVTERQEEEFAVRGLSFQSLWGRHLQLIDCQNLFCEIAKYSRVAHPEFTRAGGRSRIKRNYTPRHDIERPWYPPKWGLNDLIESLDASRLQQLDLALDQVQPDPTAPLRPNSAPHPVRLEDRLLPLGR
jgi:hypothetical protein